MLVAPWTKDLVLDETLWHSKEIIQEEVLQDYNNTPRPHQTEMEPNSRNTPEAQPLAHTPEN